MDKPTISECPNPECRHSMNKFIDRFEGVVSGTNGQGGISGRLRKVELLVDNKVSRAWLVGTSLTVVCIMCAIFIPMVTGAIRTIGIVSDRSIAMKVQVDTTTSSLNKIEERSESAHESLLHKIQSDDKYILDRMKDDNILLLNKIQAGDKFLLERLQQSNEDMRKFIGRELEETENRILATTKDHIEHAVDKALLKYEDQDK